jgi:hypothetical protein
MAAITARDKRTIRIASIGLAIYLALFFGVGGWKKLEAKRNDYQQLLAKAQREEQEVRAYENKVLLFQKYRDAFRLDPDHWPAETVVAGASAAIQNAARENGIVLGPVRETPGRTSGRELATIQFDAAGPLPAALGLIHKIQTLGFPVVIDSLQLTPDTTKPGMLKLNATVVILNFEFWRNAEVPNA